MAFSAAGLFGVSMMAIFGGPQKTGLDERLEGYGGRRPVPADGAAAKPETATSSIVRLKRRAVDLTSQVADRAGLLTRVEALLDQTNLPLRPAEALCFYAATVGAALLLALIGAPNVAVGLVMVGLAASLPVVAVKRMRRKRLLAFEKMLPDTLTLLAGSLRAGYSFLQGVEAVAQETDEPMAGELRRAIAEARLGRPMEEALGDIGVRMASQDFEWAVMAIRIQREVGGNLAELLQTVAETMNQRTRLRGEVKALTAEGRMSAIVVALLPIAIGGYMSMVAPDYIGTLFSSTVGWIMVGGSGVLAAAGFVWLRKIVNIEV
jgi:tight adherence protein B